MSESSTLNTPLTRRRQRHAPSSGAKAGLPIARLAFAGIAVLVAIVAGRVLLVDTPEGGRPFAEVPINATARGNSIAGQNSSASIQVIEAGPEITPAEVDAALAAQQAAGPAAPADKTVSDPFGRLPELMEQTEFGALPRQAASGETPFAAYSRPSVSPATAAGQPLIAIVVTGLGINLEGTLQAVTRLPDTVTLAFAPYGKNLERTVGAARAEGHEIFLEVPLEPFDYPDNDPGPDTLLTGQAPRDNIGKLYRVMGKFGGYAGLINNMGARFTASSADFGPIMEEVGARGLGYIDDASSNRSPRNWRRPTACPSPAPAWCSTPTRRAPPFFRASWRWKNRPAAMASPSALPPRSPSPSTPSPSGRTGSTSAASSLCPPAR
jgi:hypothetical protein